MGNNKENKKKFRSIFDHKIAMLHLIYTLEVLYFSWQNVLSNKEYNNFFCQRQVSCFAVMGHISQYANWRLYAHFVVAGHIYVMWSSNMSRNSQILFLRYRQTKPIVYFVSCLFNPSTVCIFGTNCPISVGFSPTFTAQTIIENTKKTKNHIFRLQTHFAWSHLIYSLRLYYYTFVYVIQYLFHHCKDAASSPTHLPYA